MSKPAKYFISLVEGNTAVHEIEVPSEPMRSIDRMYGEPDMVVVHEGRPFVYATYKGCPTPTSYNCVYVFRAATVLTF